VGPKAEKLTARALGRVLARHVAAGRSVEYPELLLETAAELDAMLGQLKRDARVLRQARRQIREAQLQIMTRALARVSTLGDIRRDPRGLGMAKGRRDGTRNIPRTTISRRKTMAFTSVRRALAGQVPVPPAYTAAVKAKLERDRKSYAAFRQADQQQHDRAHEQRVTAAVAMAEDEVRLWRLDIEDAEPEAAKALTAFRVAEDRARETREYARRQRAAYERIKGKCTAQEETDALILADSSDSVAADAGEVMGQLQAELTTADQVLAEAREGLAAAERELDRARKAAGIPAGPAPISDATIRANAGLYAGR
jgi:hypothetical protein